MPFLDIVEKQLVASPIDLSHVISPENDDWGFAFPVDLALHGDELLVLENQNARIVVFDSAYRAVRTVGQEGSGPGELRGVRNLEVWGDEFAVGEINNSRISLFSPDGTFLRSVSVPRGGVPFAYGPGGVLYVIAGVPAHYLYLVGRDGLQRSFAERPLARYPPALVERASPFAWTYDEVAVTPDSSVYVYDVYLATIRRFDPSGNPNGEIALPNWIRDELLARQERASADFGGRGPVYQAPIGQLTTTHDGKLLLIFSTIDGVFGLLVDPASWQATRLTWAPDSPQAERRSSGRDAVLRGRTLYQIHGDNVEVFRLEPTRTD